MIWQCTVSSAYVGDNAGNNINKKRHKGEADPDTMGNRFGSPRHKTGDLLLLFPKDEKVPGADRGQISASSVVGFSKESVWGRMARRRMWVLAVGVEKG